MNTHLTYTAAVLAVSLMMHNTHTDNRTLQNPRHTPYEQKHAHKQEASFTRFKPMHTPRKVIICDLHGTAFDKNIPWHKALFAALKKEGWLRNMTRDQIGDLTKTIWDHVCGNSAPDALFVAIANKYENKALAELVVEIVNSRSADPRVINRLKTLKAMGFELIVGSNMSEGAYRDLSTHSENRFMQDCFSGNAGVTRCDSPEQTITKKPSALYYEQLLANNNLNPATDTIAVIDIDKASLDAAHQAGISTCIEYRNLAQLDQELAKAFGIGNQLGIHS